jgi:tetratricopeptide (TPR) repeat protein
MSDLELQINVDLFEALVEVLGAEPSQPEPVVILAAHLYQLSKGYGLSESSDLTESQLERAFVPEPAVALVQHYFGDEASSTAADSFRDRLYSVFLNLSRRSDVRKLLNKNEPLSETGLLTVAQIFWNLEAGVTRQKLPIRSGQKITTENAKSTLADIKVPNSNRDFATMKWTERTRQGATGLGAGQAFKSSGQGFRKQGARLAVLAAQNFVDRISQPLAIVAGAALRVVTPDRGKKSAVIVWTIEDEAAAPRSMALPEIEVERKLRPREQVLVGAPADVGNSYQRRGFDDLIEKLWADDGDRRLWLRGGPGRGKSYTARRVMQEAIASQGTDREELLIWVDSADKQSFRQSLSAAVDRTPWLGIKIDDKDPDQVDRQARALLEVLATSGWRWLIVLDNADAEQLTSDGLIPSGRNPNGRVLVTTLSPAHRINNHGQVIEAELFTSEEADAFLATQVERAPAADRTKLAHLVGYHPLALSIAAATIVTNAMEVRDWIAEFDIAERMDEAADEEDGGGYPGLIGATWRVALDKASQGLAGGIVQRAAAVAAVLDPDGHPTWLWERDRVIAWVAGETTLARRPGRPPVAVQRLIDNGVVDLVGGSWRQGQIAIHQLAARAVRELVPNDDLEALGTILADEWLRRLGEDEQATQGAIRGNIQSLVSGVELAKPAHLTATALLGFSGLYNRSFDSGANDTSRLKADMVSQIEEDHTITNSVIEHLGPSGKSLVAGDAALLALLKNDLGRHAESHEHFIYAIQIYRAGIEDRDAHDADRAKAFVDMADLFKKLGTDEDTRAAREKAAAIYQRLLNADPGVEERFRYVTEIAELHQKLGNLVERDATLLRNYDQLMLVAEFAPIGTSEAEIRLEVVRYLRRLEALVGHQRTLGKLDDAKASLTLAVAVASGTKAWSFERDLVRLHVETSCWAEAEACQGQLVSSQGREDDSSLADDLVRLASIQRHNHHLGKAAKNLARAAQIYQAIEPIPRNIEPEVKDPREGALGLLSRLAGAEFLAERWGNAQHTFAAVVNLMTQHADANPGDYEVDLADALSHYGLASLEAGQPSVALEPLTRAVAIRDTLAGLMPTDVAAQETLASTLHGLGQAHLVLEQFEKAVAARVRAVAVRQGITEASPADHEAQARLAIEVSMFASLLLRIDRFDEALEAYQRASNILRKLIDSEPDYTVARSALAENLGKVGDAFASHGWQNEAAARWEEQETVLRTIAGRRPDVPEPLLQLAKALSRYGRAHSETDRLEEAVGCLAQAITLYQDIPEDALASNDYAHATAHYYLSGLYKRLDQTDQWLAHITMAVEMYRRLSNQNPNDHDTQFIFASFLAELGEALRHLGRQDETIENFIAAANILQLLVDLGAVVDPAMLQLAELLSRDLNLLGETLLAAGMSGEGELLIRRADELARKFPDLDAPSDG